MTLLHRRNSINKKKDGKSNPDESHVNGLSKNVISAISLPPSTSTQSQNSLSASATYPHFKKSESLTPTYRCGFYAGKLNKAKMSNKDLKNMTKSSSVLSTTDIFPSFTISSTKYPFKMKGEFFHNECHPKKRIKKKLLPVLFLALTIISVLIFTMKISLLHLYTYTTKAAHGNHKHVEIPRSVEIKLSVDTTSKLNDHPPFEQHTLQNIHLRSSSSGSNDRSSKVHGRMANQDPNNNHDQQHHHHQKHDMNSGINKKNLPSNEDNFNNLVIDPPTDFFHATTSTSSPLGGYAQLPFPVYCPHYNFENSSSTLSYEFTTKIECEYSQMAWSASLWIHPTLPDSSLTDMEIEPHTSTPSTKKRIIFSNSVLELYLNEFSQLTLSFKFISSSSAEILVTEMSVSMNRWTHVGLSMVPIKSSNNDYPIQTVDSNSDKVNLRLYIEGKERVSRVLKITNPPNNENEVETTRIGQDYYNDNGFEGRIAMLAIWTNNEETNDSKTIGQPGIFRDDYMMKSSHRAGLDWNDLMHLERHGLVKSPNFLYSFRVTSLKKGEKMSEQPIVSPLIESIQDRNGILFRPTLLIFPELFVPAGPNSYPEYKNGDNTPHKVSKIQQYQYDVMARLRRVNIRNAMKHVWKGYKAYAYGKDELKPLKKNGHDNWGGMCTTLVDSLDTLWLMNMKDEFWEGRDWIREHLDFDLVNRPISVFETTIRNLGGLLSAHDLSGDAVFLEKAEDLGNRMLKAFDSPSGLPYGETDLNSDNSNNLSWLGNKAILAEIGTLQLEFRYLAQITGKRKFAAKAERAMLNLVKMKPKSGLYPVYINNLMDKAEFFSKKISLGALGDSFYEYLLKVWLQGGKREKFYRNAYDLAIDGVENHLLQKSAPTGLYYIAELNESGGIVKKMDHLVCFLPGTLALGAFTNPDGVESKRAQRDLHMAKSLAYTCYQMYARTKSGLASEFVEFDTENGDFRVPKNGAFNILRPETAESLYILHHLTGDNIYREWGWEIFRAIEHFCWLEAGYGSLYDVDNPGKGVQDKMESFFLAETLKYLYLLQDPDSSIDILNEHVFNTEAHPLRINEQLRKEKRIDTF